MIIPHAPPTTTVLIVDDQPAYREAAGLVVELADGFHAVGVAESGEEGVTMAGQLRPDIVLMDVNLPGIDGFEATRQLLRVSPDSHVLILSTYSADEYRDLALTTGAVGFVSKSDFAPSDLEGLAGR